MFSDLCGDISFQSDTRLLGVLGTPGLKGQKGDIVSIWDEFEKFQSAYLTCPCHP